MDLEFPLTSLSTKKTVHVLFTLEGTSMQKFSSWVRVRVRVSLSLTLLASLTEIVFSLNIYAQCPLLILICIKIIYI